MIIQTKRLILRKFEETDAESYALLAADPEVMRFSLSGPRSQEQANEFFQKEILAHYQKHGFGLFAVFLKETHDFIGFVGLIFQTVDETQELKLAYRLLPKYWRQGFATEAAKAVCEYAFQTLKVERLLSCIDPKNYNSISVANRVGMHFWKEAICHGIAVNVYCLTKITVMP